MSFLAIGQLSNIIFVSLLDSDLLRIVLINMINMINMINVKLNVFLIKFVNIFKFLFWLILKKSAVFLTKNITKWLKKFEWIN